MARLLIRMKDNLWGDHPNPTMALRPGDLVAVLPDDHIPGEKEMEPDFLWVDYPGVPIERFKRFAEQEWDQEQDVPWDDLDRRNPDGSDREVRQAVARRLYKFTREALTVDEEAATRTRSPEHLVVDDTTGDVTRSRMDELLLNKRTSQTAKDEGRPV